MAYVVFVRITQQRGGVQGNSCRETSLALAVAAAARRPRARGPAAAPACGTTPLNDARVWLAEAPPAAVAASMSAASTASVVKRAATLPIPRTECPKGTAP